MREIKFRAWQSRDNIMLTWGKLQHIKQFVLDDLISKDSVIVLPVNKEITLMQYTGLKDKNGVEIYESDIVKLPDQYRPSGISRFKQDQLFEIQFIDGHTYCRNIKYNEQAKYYYGTELYKIHNKCEVIGNIYENPELLETK